MNGVPAFPRSGFYRENGIDEEFDCLPQKGMTLRDYFAAKAMPLVFTKGVIDKDGDDLSAARAAYQIADAMLAARET
jgi:hypothetical protein